MPGRWLCAEGIASATGVAGLARDRARRTIKVARISGAAGPGADSQGLMGDESRTAALRPDLSAQKHLSRPPYGPTAEQHSLRNQPPANLNYARFYDPLILHQSPYIINPVLIVGAIWQHQTSLYGGGQEGLNRILKQQHTICRHILQCNGKQQ